MFKTSGKIYKTFLFYKPLSEKGRSQTLHKHIREVPKFKAQTLIFGL